MGSAAIAIRFVELLVEIAGACWMAPASWDSYAEPEPELEAEPLEPHKLAVGAYIICVGTCSLMLTVSGSEVSACRLRPTPRDEAEGFVLQISDQWWEDYVRPPTHLKPRPILRRIGPTVLAM